MRAGAKQRSLMVQMQFDALVSLHQRLRVEHPLLVLLVFGADTDEQAAKPVAPIETIQDGRVLIVAVIRGEGLRWLAAQGAEETSFDPAKWDPPATDAMDVAAISVEGISVMRFTAR